MALEACLRDRADKPVTPALACVLSAFLLGLLADSLLKVSLPPPPLLFPSPNSRCCQGNRGMQIQLLLPGSPECVNLRSR